MTHATTRRASGLRDLDDDWDQRFADRPYFLDEPTTPARLLEFVRHSPVPARDQLLHQLLTRAHEGDRIAARIVLQAMLPKAVSLARSCAALRQLPTADAQWDAVAAMWQAIDRFPLSRTSGIAMKLGMSALSIITDIPHGDLDHELPVDPSLMPEGAADDPAGARTGDCLVDDLVEVFTWGIDNDVLTADEVRLLATFDLGTDADKASLPQRCGITRAALLKRVWRIRTRLMEAVQAEINANGQW